MADDEEEEEESEGEAVAGPRFPNPTVCPGRIPFSESDCPGRFRRRIITWNRRRTDGRTHVVPLYIRYKIAPLLE